MADTSMERMYQALITRVDEIIKEKILQDLKH